MVAAGIVSWGCLLMYVVCRLQGEEVVVAGSCTQERAIPSDMMAEDIRIEDFERWQVEIRGGRRRFKRLLAVQCSAVRPRSLFAKVASFLVGRLEFDFFRALPLSPSPCLPSY